VLPLSATNVTGFPRELITHAVWLYLNFPLNFRLIEEMLLERGIAVS
jgi:putative transposase